MPNRSCGRALPAALRRLLPLAIAPLALLGVACAKPSAQKLNEDGNQAYSRGDYQPALDDYRKAQVARPDLPALNYNAGNVLYQQGDYARAISEAQRSTNASDPDIAAKSFYSVGENYYRQGKLHDALDAFKNALRIDPSDHDAKYNVEVIQAQLDKEAANLAQIQQQAQQNQQNTPNNQPQSGQNQQNQPNGQNQPSPQSQPGPQGQPNQNGQPQPGQGQPGAPQPGQGQPNNPGQPGQPGQPAQSQPNVNSQPGSQPGQLGQPAGQPSSGSVPPGGTGTAAPSRQQQAQELQGELQAAIDQYNRSPSIDEALQILDIVAQQEQLAQAQQAGRTPPGVTDK